MDKLLPYLQKIASTLDRLEPFLPPDNNAINFTENHAFRWIKRRHSPFGTLIAIKDPASVNFKQLKGVDRQIAQIRQNTEQFIAGYPANNVLLTGSRRTGQSSIVTAVLANYHVKNLRLIEIDSDELRNIPELLAILQSAPN